MKVDVLADTINPYTGVRITTLYCVYPQDIHPQMLTHRMFSRNSSSTRAISFKRYQGNFPEVYPQWTLEQKGMVGKEASEAIADRANMIISNLYQEVIKACNLLDSMGIHHQNINSYLKPFTEIHTVITATEWYNFFTQRISEFAKPEIRELATLIQNEMAYSIPKSDSVHMPLGENLKDYSLEEKAYISAARLARISYYNWQDDPKKDLDLAKKLVAQKHPSPFEHIAFAKADNNFYANFNTWQSFRRYLENQGDL